PDALLALTVALGRFWHLRGNWEEALDWLGRALASAPGAPPRLRAAALLHLGRLNFFLGAEDEARRQLEEGLALAREGGDAAQTASVLEALAQAYLKVGADERALEAL